jgi:hypothetical protein
MSRVRGYLRAAAPWVLGVLFILAVLLFAGWVSTHISYGEVKRTQYVEPGTERVCVIVQTRAAVAVDCDYPPTESRLKGFLEGVSS